jgi:hypothetical protein
MPKAKIFQMLYCIVRQVVNDKGNFFQKMPSAFSMNTKVIR